MAEIIPIKLIVCEPDIEPQEYIFEQDMIKIGRGRTGAKARKKAVDVQVSDPTVERVHTVINVRKLDDVFAMDMGGASTKVDGKMAGARGKLRNGSVLELGNTKITIYIGEEATKEHNSTTQGAISGIQLDGSSDMIAISSGEYDVLEDRALNFEEEKTPPQGAEPMSVTPTWAEAFSESAASTDASDITPEHTGTAFSGNIQEYVFYPMHSESESTFGPLGPPPPPLPERYPPASKAMLLEVFDRLGKEIWFVQEQMW